MKKCLILMMVAALVLSLCPAAVADDAGVLTEQELGAWISQLLLSTKDKQPLNSPITQDALTQDGYAFIYDEATLYYDKPELDAKSVLQAVSVTSEALETPRGLKLGDTQAAILSVYGWLNPDLTGDESLAPLYQLDQLPAAAYWAWAQREGQTVLRVQCAIHVLSGENYTNAGVNYSLDGGVITAIQVYGLNQMTTPESVAGNLQSLSRLSGEETAAPNASSSEQAEFTQEDLVFSGLDYRTLNETVATQVFGAAGDESWAQESSVEWMHTTERTDVMITYIADQNKQNEHADALVITQMGFVGPRGMKIGDAQEVVLALFRADNQQQTLSSGATLLYGDGQDPPYALMENNGDATITARYCANMTASNGESKQVNLYLTFFDGYLSEIMVYSW